MADSPRTTTNKGGRPRKYHTLEERKKGINAARRARRHQAQSRQHSINTGLSITFERCDVPSPVDSMAVGVRTPLRSTSPPAKDCNPENEEEESTNSTQVVVHVATASEPNTSNYKQSLQFIQSITTCLCDPLVQDLCPEYRYYVRHFADSVCQDLVSYDTPGNNPYRSLLAMMKECPLLLHLIVANSAMHLINLFAPKLHLDPSLESKQSGSADQVIMSLRRHALSAKSKALNLLNTTLKHANAENWVIALASIILFIDFELISSGKNDWKIHVEGAKRLIACFDFAHVSLDSSISQLRDFAISDCITYYVLGSSLRPRKSNMDSTPFTLNVRPLLERAEANTYVSCPAALLQVTLVASNFLEHDEAMTLEIDQSISDQRIGEAYNLLQTVQTFDVYEWAISVQGISVQSDLDSRVHLAMAYKSAVCLYIHSAIPSAKLLSRTDIDAHVKNIISNISFIAPGNKLLKGTSWPTFIAGAEATSHEQVTWVLERLRLVWEVLPWGYLNTTTEILKGIWKTKVMREAAGGTWLQRVRGMGNHWIVV